MYALAARLMITMGTGLLVLALFARLTPLTPANVVGDDLAIVASSLVILTGVITSLRTTR